jgi:hypothetical protein
VRRCPLRPSSGSGQGTRPISAGSPRVVAVALLLCAVLVLASGASSAPAWARSGVPYDLTWNSVDGGGGTFSTGGTYTLGGTIGQPDAGPLTGDRYELQGGFWGGAYIKYGLHLPVVVRKQ